MYAKMRICAKQDAHTQTQQRISTHTQTQIDREMQVYTNAIYVHTTSSRLREIGKSSFTQHDRGFEGWVEFVVFQSVEHRDKNLILFPIQPIVQNQTTKNSFNRNRMEWSKGWDRHMEEGKNADEQKKKKKKLDERRIERLNWGIGRKKERKQTTQIEFIESLICG